MTLFEQSSFGIPKKAAEKAVKDKIEARRDYKVPPIEFENVASPAVSALPEQFRKSGRTNTLGDGTCSRNP